MRSGADADDGQVAELVDGLSRASAGLLTMLMAEATEQRLPPTWSPSGGVPSLRPAVRPILPDGDAYRPGSRPDQPIPGSAQPWCM